MIIQVEYIHKTNIEEILVNTDYYSMHLESRQRISSWHKDSESYRLVKPVGQWDDVEYSLLKITTQVLAAVTWVVLGGIFNM